MTRILNTKQVSEKTSLSQSHLRRLTARGEFPVPVRVSTARLGWLETDVDMWIETLEKEACHD
jgi:prophage regulatory protein